MKIRDFPVVDFWTEQVNKMIDILHIEYFPHDIAHQKAREYSLSHSEYTHLLFLPDDVIATPNHVNLLIQDAHQLGHDKVICGYCNVDFSNDEVAISKTRMNRIPIPGRTDYRFIRLMDIIAGKYEYPFIKVFFQGNALTLIPRSVVEKLTFKGYRATVDTLFGKTMKRETMHDLQMAFELDELGIDVVCDLRLLVVHFGNTVRLINVKGKTPRMYLKTRSGEVRDMVEMEPYR
jgi:hypothetical protein